MTSGDPNPGWGVLMALCSLYLGHTLVDTLRTGESKGRSFTHKRDTDPVMYWISVTVIAAMTCYFAVYAALSF